jgi:pyruvate dehydrogenase E2 component (dihydrolipoamide acetyltransferase)
MAFEFKLPDIGEGVQEGEIVQWLVKPGDRVDVDQPMVEVMTDKATVVIASPKAGVVREVRGGEGDMVEVHSVIALIDTGEGAPRPSGGATEGRAAAEAAAPAADRQVGQADTGPSKPADRVLAAPATRRLARELGVELGGLDGSGPGGRVMASDVKAAAEGGAAASASGARPVAPRAPAPGAAAAEDRRIPVRGMRRRIWDNMARSTSLAAHFTFVEECDCTDLAELRARMNDHLSAELPKLSFLPFIVKAVVNALRRAPALNGQIDEEEMAFVQRGEFHLGIAVSSDRGLAVPVLRHADRRSLVDIAAEIKRLADAVRDNALRQEDLGGSTFTITSLGRDGGLFATPVINHPEVAILGVHRLRRVPTFTKDDQIEARSLMNLSLSFDHRWVDGHVGAAFTYDVIRQLEAPERLMLEMV